MRRLGWIVPLLVLLPLLVLWRVFFLGEAIGPHDHINFMSGAGLGRETSAWDVLTADGVLQFYVWRDLVFSAWGRGEIPLWNPYAMAGTPLLANSQSGALYPLHILVGVLHLPTWLGLGILAWFHLALAGLGTARLARLFGADLVGQAVAGASFLLSPFMVGWIPLASAVSTVAWIPWVLCGIVEVADPATRRRGVALLGVASAMMLLAGHLQFAAFGMMAAVLFVIGFAVVHRDAKAAVACVLALAAGGMIAAPQVLPTLQYSQFSHRRAAPTEEGFKAYQSSAIRAFEYSNFVYPMTLGNPRERLEDEGADISVFWGGYFKLGGNTLECAVSPGTFCVALLLFLPLAVKRIRAEGKGGPLAVVALCALFFFLVASGILVTRLLYFYAPGWSATGSPGRAAAVMVLLLCVMAGVSYSYLDKHAPPIYKYGALAFAVAGFASLSLTSLSGSALYFAPSETNLMKARAAAGALAGGLLSMLLAAQPIIVNLLPKATKVRIPLALAAVIVPFIAWGGALFLETGKPVEVKLPFPVKPHERIAVVNDSWNLFFRPPGFFPPNLLSLARVHEIGGYDSLIHRETKQILNEIDKKDSSPEENGNILNVRRPADMERLAEAGVSQYWYRIGMRPRLTVIDGPGRVSATNGSAEITAETLNTVSVTAKMDSPGTLTLRDRLMDGWMVQVDGKEQILKEGSRWREVELPAGEHSMVFRYTPPTWPMAWYLAACGLALLLGVTSLKTRTLEPVPAVTLRPREQTS